MINRRSKSNVKGEFQESDFILLIAPFSGLSEAKVIVKNKYLHNSRAAFCCDFDPLVQILRTGMYFERQSSQMCAVHSLNHILQRQEVSSDDLDAIADSFHPGWRLTNPHRSFWGTGDYDANVLITACGQKGFDCAYWDERKALPSAKLRECVAVVVNKKTESFWGGLIGGRHWYVIRQFYATPSKEERSGNSSSSNGGVGEGAKNAASTGVAGGGRGSGAIIAGDETTSGSKNAANAAVSGGGGGGASLSTLGDGEWWELDSTKEGPRKIGSLGALQTHLEGLGAKQLMLVKKAEDIAT